MLRSKSRGEEKVEYSRRRGASKGGKGMKYISRWKDSPWIWRDTSLPLRKDGRDSNVWRVLKIEGVSPIAFIFSVKQNGGRWQKCERPAGCTEFVVALYWVHVNIKKFIVDNGDSQIPKSRAWEASRNQRVVSPFLISVSSKAVMGPSLVCCFREQNQQLLPHSEFLPSETKAVSPVILYPSLLAGIISNGCNKLILRQCCGPGWVARWEEDSIKKEKESERRCWGYLNVKEATGKIPTEASSGGTEMTYACITQGQSLPCVCCVQLKRGSREGK